MGYTTEFDGCVELDNPLSEMEQAYLLKFSETRRMDRVKGPYYVGGDRGQDHENDIVDYNNPPVGQPGLWCQWIPTEDLCGITWDEGEKFYHAAEWLQYLIDHFIGPDPIARALYPQDASFLQGHSLKGIIYAQGEEMHDRWYIEVLDGCQVVVTELTMKGDIARKITIPRHTKEEYLSQLETLYSQLPLMK